MKHFNHASIHLYREIVLITFANFRTKKNFFLLILFFTIHFLNLRISNDENLVRTIFSIRIYLVLYCAH